MLYTDRQRLEQILKNLLSNAVKFTEHGAVSLTIAGQPDERIAFVRDSGIGIAADQQESIFEAFRQADGTTNRRTAAPAWACRFPRPGGLARRLDQRQQRAGPGQRVHPGVAAAIQRAGRRPSRRCPAARRYRARPGAAVDCGGRWPVHIPRFADDRGKAPFATRCILVVEDEPNFAHILYDLAHELGYQCLVAHGADEGYDLAASSSRMRSCWTCACRTIPG
jgi:hypothetical protein